MQLRKDLRQAASKEKAAGLSRFFKTGRGEYGEGDRFLGVMVPQTRALVKIYWPAISLADVKVLLESEWHEERLAALFILVAKFKKADDKEKEKIYKFYLANTKSINNWDLVDLSAPNIVGSYLYFIKEGDPKISLEIAEILVNDKHDLIQKAVGWMLREVGKRCGQDIEEQFLQKHYKTMPRTALRYAIERFDEPKRKFYLGI